ncbi:iron permease [Mycena maculata]|uniref:Iron permease n=1 Tax=Mycena maculata TaxID=230809 RepID=A0AAD7K3X9_9AGAR|nr:iron permease [Mycena maculata]
MSSTISPTDTSALTTSSLEKALPPSSRMGSAFWLSYIATAIPSSLPSIVKEFSGTADSSWMGSSYTPASAALVPFTGNLANIFGRRPIILGSVLLSAIGSSLAGSAQSMESLIIARTVQGMGGGGMTSLSSIIVVDLVSLVERGAYQGFKTMTWKCAMGIGPVLGGALSEKASWRWLFYINIPASGFAFFFVLFLLQVRTPEGNVWSKLASVDWFGNVLASVCFTWSDARVLAPLIAGLTLMVVFVMYEKYVVTNPTALASLVATFFNGIANISILYFLPLFFLSVFLASPLQSAIYSLPYGVVMSLFSLLNGVTVLQTRRYLPGNYAGWVLIGIGFGILGMASSRRSSSHWGPELLYMSALSFPLVASIPVERLGSALAFQAFLRTFSQTWGISSSASILQNTVKGALPAQFIRQLPAGSDFVFAAVSRIAGLPEPLQSEVSLEFAHGITALQVYRVMIGTAGLGLLCVFFMQEVPMRGPEVHPEGESRGAGCREGEQGEDGRRDARKLEEPEHMEKV